MFKPSFEQFKVDYEAGRTVRVHGLFMGDSITPVSAFLKIKNGPYGCLLESVTGGEHIGRYSFVANSPVTVFRAYGKKIEIEKDGEMHSFITDDPIHELDQMVKKHGPVAEDSLPRLAGGAVGYLGYDAIRYIEHLPNIPKNDLGLPDLYFCIYETMLVFDNVDKSLRIVTNVFPSSDSVEDAYDEAITKIRNIAKTLGKEASTPLEEIEPKSDIHRVSKSNFDKETFLQAVDKCKEYIRAGDIFQVVLSQRFHAVTEVVPFNVYRALRTINPSPYMFYLSFGDLQLIGASPEVMARVEDDLLTVRPIAGTRKRGKTVQEEQKMEEELLNDPKERAEHVMLLDLGRNDVGKVCEFKSVEVTQEMELEKYSHVMHLTSNVQGKLLSNRTSMDAFKSCFPAGTVSGAPKIRAMEIIDELEPTKRGPYAGAVGYIDFAGNMDTAIAIRTIVMTGQNAYVQAGAGIVADSIPELEFKETENKARALLKALDVAERELKR